MATIATKRMQPWHRDPGNAPSTVNLPLQAAAGNQGIIPGDLLLTVVANGQVVANNAPGNVTTLFAIAEGSTTASTPVANTLMPATLLMPFVLWEGTFIGTSAQTDLTASIEYDVADNAVGCVINKADTTDPKVWVVLSPGQSGAWTIHPFIAKADASPTAGQTMSPVEFGIPGDINIRVLFTWDKDRLAVGV